MLHHHQSTANSTTILQALFHHQHLTRKTTRQAITSHLLLRSMNKKYLTSLMHFLLYILIDHHVVCISPSQLHLLASKNHHYLHLFRLHRHMSTIPCRCRCCYLHLLNTTNHFLPYKTNVLL